MTWDNAIGCMYNTPYDCNNVLNMQPHGNTCSGVDECPSQWNRFRPIPELSDYRTPVKDLYATGAGWPPFGGAHSWNGYNCYKIIAEDPGLRKPWDEKGRPY